MSTTIDQKVVQMEFDNKDFERRVSNTMSTVDKLKQALKFDGVSKGFDDVSRAAKGVNLSGLSNAAEMVTAKFSYMQMSIQHQINRIVDTAVNAGKRIAKALTTDPITTGFSEYETQINAVQTILANTEHKGTDINDVNKALDELNSYADKTIYNFTEMTRNIGTFTAAGVDLDKSVTSIKGIANLAAVSGSTSQQASTAMYQLSQALATGRVSLMDWNSVVNAGMGGQVFQEALKRTARNMGTDVDAMIEKYGSFRESLTQGEWLTADVLTETLTQLSGAYTEADLLAKGYSKDQAAEILKLADTAEQAATKVKTFTQLYDTLKEAAQSGWTQTWEYIVGDFEEAKATLSAVSDAIGDIINKSAEARNALVKGWKDAGGRDDLIESFKNAFEGIKNIVGPIKEAFREIFPPMTVDNLVNFTTKLKELTSSFRDFAEKHAPNIKRIFKGVFAIFDIAKEAVSGVFTALKPLFGGLGDMGGGFLEFAAKIGDAIVKFDEFIKTNDVFKEAGQWVADTIENIVIKVKNFISAVKEFSMPGIEFLQALLERIRTRMSDISSVASEMKDGVSNAIDTISQSFGKSDFLKMFAALWQGIKTISSGLIKALSALTGGLFDKLAAGDFQGIFDLINTISFSAIAGFIAKFVKGFSDITDSVGDFKENILGILDEVRGCFEAYQTQLKAGSLMKIASAIALLTGSILVLSLIDSAKLSGAIGALTMMFTELIGSLAIIDKLSINQKGLMTIAGSMIGISIAVLLLSSALKKISSLSLGEMVTGLIGVAGLMAMVVGSMKLLSGSGKTVMKGATQMVIIAAAIKILVSASEDLAQMKWEELGKGLAGIGGLLAEMSLFANLTKNTKGMISMGVGMVAMGASMKIFASATKDLSQLKWEEIGKGLAAMAGALAAVAISARIMPKNMVGIGVGLIAVSTALVIISEVLEKTGGMKWSEIGKGLVAVGGAITILAIGLNAMTGTIGGSAALLIAAGALALLTPVMKILGGMSWGSIAKGLITIAGAFTVIGIAGALLKPLIPAILGLAASVALLGVGILAAGVGLATLAVGFTALAAAMTGGAVAIASGLTVIITAAAGLIPMIITKIGEGIVAFCGVIADGAPAIGEAIKAVVLSLVDVLVECAPAIAEGALKLISGLLDMLVVYTPKIIDSLSQFLIGTINGLAEKMPELTQAGANLIMSFFSGIVDALTSMNIGDIFKGALGLGIMTGIMYALSGVAALVPGAMVGVLGIGAVIAELAIVLAAVGALAQIPGLNWLINEGGELLGSIGTAIGKLVGGIVGGFAEGLTDSLPDIATNLSNFMTNLTPFLDGVKMVDPDILGKVGGLAGAIIALTAADLLASIADFLTGGASFAQLGLDLSAFMTNAMPFITGASMISGEMMSGVKALAETVLILTAADVINGLTSWFTGGSSLADFGAQLPQLGTHLSQFANNLGTFTEDKVTSVNCAADAIKSLATAAETLPNEGGWLAKIVGDNSISTFGANLPTLGTNIASFATNLGTFDDAKVTTVTCAADAIKALALAAEHIPNEGGWFAKIVGDNSISTFGAQLPTLGTAIAGFASNLGTFDTAKSDTVTAAAEAVKSLALAASGIPETGGWLSKIFGDENIDTFATKMPTLGEGIAGFAEKAGNIDTEVMNKAISALEAIINLSNSDLATLGVDILYFGDQINDFADDFDTFATTINNIDTDGMTDKVDDIKQIATDISGIDISGFQKFCDSLKQIATDGVKKFTTAVSDAANAAKVKEAATKMLDKFIAGLESKETDVKSAAEDIASAAASAVKNEDAYDGFYAAGGYLVDGFVEGIDENTYKAEAEAAAMAEAAEEAARKALDVNSPSKVFKRLGGSVPEGMALGIVRLGGLVKTAATNMATDAIYKVKDCISRISEAVNTDIDSEPTITPVLDLSQVKTGVNAIDGLFSQNHSVGVLGNVGAISSMMSGYGQNGGNGDVIKAINKLGTSIAKQRGNTVNVNGVTYDDGSAVNSAVQELVHALQLGGRV